jgi:hypothetical protein
MAAGMAVQGLLAVASAQLNQFLQQVTEQPGRMEAREGGKDEKPHR